MKGETERGEEEQEAGRVRRRSVMFGEYFVVRGGLRTYHVHTHRFGPLDNKTISHYTRQIARGLDYLHTNGIIHRLDSERSNMESP